MIYDIRINKRNSEYFKLIEYNTEKPELLIRELDLGIKDLEIIEKSKFKVIGVDTFSNDECDLGEYDTKTEAIEVATVRGGTMFKTHVYDPSGKRIYSGGIF